MVEEVKASFKRILLAHKGEITLDKIEGEYRKSSGELLRVDNYGFKSIEDLLKTFEDVVTISSGERDETILQLIGDDTTTYIEHLLTKQRHRKDTSQQGSTHPRPSHRKESPRLGQQESFNRLPGNSPSVPSSGSRMDQDNSESAAGRGRGRILKKALADVQSIERPGQEPFSVREDVMSDSKIKAWIIKELSSKPNGFLARAIPKLFESEFESKAPDDLLARIKSLEDTINVENGPAGDILYLKKAIAISQSVNREPVEKPHVACKVDENCEERDETSAAGTIGQWQLPEEGSKVDVHVLYTNTPDDFCICPYNLHPKLTRLMIELNQHFKKNTKTVQPVQSVAPGSVYAGNYGGSWYRVRVESAPGPDNKVVALLADYSMQVQVEADTLVTLPGKFTHLPFCGVKAQLHGVLPDDLDKGWTEMAVVEFRKIVDRRDFVCVVCEGGGDGRGHTPVGVRLVDTSQEDDIIVDEILEELGLISRAQFE